MEIYQLRYFLAVAETGSFTKAAQRSFVSQPSLSQQILNLEEEFGQKLFHRLGRKAVLTEGGKTLLEGTHRILTEVDQTMGELKSDPIQGPRVTVGAIPTVAPFFLPAVLAYCRANEIHLSLNTQENFRAPLLEALHDGKLDWALVSLPIDEPQLHVEKLYSEPLWLALSADHILAHDELAPRLMGRSATDPEGLVFRKFAGETPSRDIGLVRHRRRHLGPGAALFAQAARAVVGPEPSLGTTPPFRFAAPPSPT